MKGSCMCSRSTDHVLLMARSLCVPLGRGLLLMDTTWRDAHQSLMATRVRGFDMLAGADALAHIALYVGIVLLSCCR